MYQSFKEFLWKTADEMPDRSVSFHQKSYFRNLFEMAEEGDRIRFPVHIDEEDLEFLKQFDEIYWPSALYQRYQMLFDEIEKMHNNRMEAGMGRLKDEILKAIKTQNWNKLKELESHLVLPDLTIDRLKRDYANHTKNDDELNAIADKMATKHMKEQDYFVGDPATAVFRFPKFIKNKQGKLKFINRAKEKVEVVAKPYLNRLYHRLERSYGHPHSEDSGLEGLGKYGFDMAHPVRAIPTPEGLELPHTTAGMKFPTYKQIADRMQEFLAHNSHRTFGDIKGEDLIWKKVQNREDTETAGFHLKKFEKEFYNQNKNNSAEFATKDAVLKAARIYAKKQVIKMAKRKELLGPPIPGVDERGRPSRSKTTRFPVKVAKNVDGQEVLVNPPLFLPYKKEIVNGKAKLVPAVNPAFFYRELGTDDNDFMKERVTDEDGNEIVRNATDENGKPIWSIPHEMRLGHEGKYVKVKDDEFKYGKEVQKDGSIDFNHNSESLHHYIPGTEEYEKVFSDIFANQKQVEMAHNKTDGHHLVDSEDSGMTEDIMRGILNCIRMASCGEKTDFEKSKMLQSVDLIYQIIFNTMIMDLRKHQIGNLDSKRGRREYARHKASMYAQYDLGGGSRRLRALTPAARRRHRRNPRAGIRNIPANLEEYRDFKAKLYSLRSKALRTDQEVVSTIQTGKTNLTQGSLNAMINALKNRYDVANELHTMLVDIHSQYKDQSSTESSEDWANSQIRSWAEDNYNSNMMLQQFQQLPLVRKALANEGQAAPASQERPGEALEEIKTAIRMFMHEFNNDLQRAGGDVNNRLIQNKYKPKPSETVSKYVRSQLKPAILEMPDFDYLKKRVNADELKNALETIQKEINKQLMYPHGLVAAAPVVAGATPVAKMGPKPEGQEWLQFFQQGTPQSIFYLTQDDNFHRQASNNLLTAVRSRIEKNSSKYNPDDYKAAMDRVEATMRQRGIRIR